MTSDEYRELKGLIETHQADTRAELTAVRAELAGGFADMRRHFKVVTEDLGGRITLVAEGHAALDQKVTSLDGKVTWIDRKVDALDLKVTWLQEQVTSLHAGQRAVVAAVQEMMGQE